MFLWAGKSIVGYFESNFEHFDPTCRITWNGSTNIAILCYTILCNTIPGSTNNGLNSTRQVPLWTKHSLNVFTLSEFACYELFRIIWIEFCHKAGKVNEGWVESVKIGFKILKSFILEEDFGNNTNSCHNKPRLSDSSTKLLRNFLKF